MIKSLLKSAFLKTLLSVIALVTALTIMLCSCSSLPTRTKDKSAPAPETHRNTRLSKLFSTAVGEHGDESGFLLMRNGKRALQERIYLADLAERQIDAQYYIWNSDKSGRLLMQRFLLAAERGVSVRLILDDFSIGNRNVQLLVLNSHPNIQIRAYNPFVMRSGMRKWINFALDFDRLNRRMHNKTFIADGTTAITGGRNIGDEYFGANEHLNFNDVDLFSIGPVVKQVSASFSRYWDSPWAVPIDRLLKVDTEESADNELQDFLKRDLSGPLQISLATEPDIIESHFRALLYDVIWAPASFIADDPGGTANEAYSEGPKRVARHLLQLAGNDKRG